MSASHVPVRPSPAEYPNHLADPQPRRAVLPGRPWLLAGLLLLCLVPRALMASRTRIVCPDAIRYIRAARALEQGDLQTGFRDVHLNTFPLLLIVLHRTGLDWELAGKWLGVVASSLVVLPLYGWVRRQFDDRVALAAGFLYAVHAKFIQWSPEILRDPVFWLFFMLSIYLLWRAMTEVRLRLFMAAGLAITLASLTRFEGLFLLVPLLLWSLWRWTALRRARRRLLVGGLLCVIIGPVLLLLVNTIWLANYDRWEFSRMKPLAMFQQWCSSMIGLEYKLPVDQPAKMSAGRMCWVFVTTMERGMTPLFGLLLLGGLWRWRRVWARRDHQPLFYVALAVMGGIWVHLWHAQISSTRYPLPVALMAAGFPGLALVGVVGWVRDWARRRQWQTGWVAAVAVAPVLLVAAVGVADALRRNYNTREVRASLGHWVNQQFGPSPTLIGHQGLATTANYYAQGRCRAFEYYVDDEQLVALARQMDPDVVLLSETHLEPDRRITLTDRMKHLGFERVDHSRLPPGCEQVFVLARHRAGRHLLVGPAGGSGRVLQ